MKTSQILLDLFDLSITGIAGVTRRIALMQKPTPKPPPSAGITEEIWSRVQAGKTYLKALFRIILYCSAFPLPILALGMVANLGWLVATVGIFWALCTLILLVLATPVGFLIEGILGGIKGIGERYVKFSLSVFLIELLFTLFVSVVPIHNNPAAIPIVILASAILGIIGAMGVKTPMSQRVIASLVTIVFVIFTLSFFFPQTFKTFTNWWMRLDAKMSRQVGEPTSSLGNSETPLEGVAETPEDRAARRELQAMRDQYKRNLQRQIDSIEESRRKNKLSTTSSDNGASNSARVRRISGTAYSYSKEVWASVHPIYSFRGNGRYPQANLIFRSGLVTDPGDIKWDGSYTLGSDQLSVVVSKLRVDAGTFLREFYNDIGIGYDIQLENAVFSDYTMTKSVMVFRTFGGDSPPPKIEKSYEIKTVKRAEEEPYLMRGEWTGSYQSKQTNGSTTSTRFTARFVQKGNWFEGVIIDSYTVAANTRRPSKARTQVEGLIVDDKVTFVKTYNGQPAATSYIATFVEGVSSLEGTWHVLFERGRWKMIRQGDFKGSPDDILSVEDPNP